MGFICPIDFQGMQLDIRYRLPDTTERDGSCKEMDSVSTASQCQRQLDTNPPAAAETRMTHHANLHIHTPLMKGLIYSSSHGTYGYKPRLGTSAITKHRAVEKPTAMLCHPNCPVFCQCSRSGAPSRAKAQKSPRMQMITLRSNNLCRSAARAHHYRVARSPMP